MLELFGLSGQELGLIHHHLVPFVRVTWPKKICNLLMSGFLEVKPGGFISILTFILNSFSLSYATMFGLPYGEKSVIWTKVTLFLHWVKGTLDDVCFFSSWSFCGPKLVTASQYSFHHTPKSYWGGVGGIEDCEISLFSGASSRQGSNILFMLHWAKCPISYFLSSEQVSVPQIYLLAHHRPQITSAQDLPIHLALSSGKS